MGMYTELIFGARFKKDTPSNIIETIKYLLEQITVKPENFLWSDQLRNPLCGGSYSFGVNKHFANFYCDEVTKCWVLSVRSSVKNYDEEIEQFLKLVEPHIYSGSGLNDLYAVVMHEGDEQPMLYYLNDGYGFP